VPVDAEVDRQFRQAVNMSADELERWLRTEQSRSVGASGSQPKSGPGGPESTGHESGRRIVEILRKKKADLDADDEGQMKRVVGYVHRHLAQQPTKEPIEDSRWRYSLMNWGHDPLK
jgi:hypothetical protein